MLARPLRCLSLHCGRQFFNGFPGFNANDVVDQPHVQRSIEDARLRHDAMEELLTTDSFTLRSPLSCPRSVLFVPCSNKKALAKIPFLDADVFILDLEDSVAPSQKVAARDNLAEVIENGSLAGKRLVVRVNSPRENPKHGFVDLDLVGSLGERVEGVGIPKTTSSDFELIENSIHPDHTLWAFFETPEGVLDSHLVLKSGHYRVACMGLNDLCAEMNIPLSLTSSSSMSEASDVGFVVPRRWPLHTSMSMVALAARACGVHPIDGVFNDPTDVRGLRAELQECRMLGFAGKTLIHPNQIAPTNAAFTPTEEEVRWARKVIEAVRSADGGVAVVEGKMVEDLHARQALRIVQRAPTPRGAGDSGASAEGEDEAVAARDAERRLRRERMVPGKRSTAAPGEEPVSIRGY